MQHIMDAGLRDLFDEHLEHVLRELPPRIHELLNQVPLVVEDHPSRKLRRSLGVRRRDALCGLYRGVPLIQRSVEQSGIPSDVVHLFREGIMALARDRHGRIDPDALDREIRITILHELGHYHGLGEQELEQLGY